MKTVTIQNTEILLPLSELVDAVTKKTGLKHNELFFSSTHAHSGPGVCAKSKDAVVWVTSLNGDYIGYLTPSELFC